MTPRTVGIIGYGHFGAFIAELLQRFTPHIHVRIFSRHEPIDGVRFFSLNEVAASDVVVLADPIHTLEEVLQAVVPLVAHTSVIVDVATVKAHPVALLSRLVAGTRYIAIHPMFGPESYKKKNKEVNGFRIVVTAHTLEVPEYETLKSFCAALGFVVLEMSAETHDRNLAETLFLTHFIGQVVAQAGFVRTDIDTVSFGYLMDAVESVKNDTALFKDVYEYVPYCKEVLTRFNVSEKKVANLLVNT